MKLLIVTQTVDRNDPVLGFFCGWVEEFAKGCEKVEVICLREGEYALPGNVRVESLGKVGGGSGVTPHPSPLPGKGEGADRLGRRVGYVLRFLHLIWRERKNYDAVFVHMNPEYVVLGGWLWRLLGKRVGLWYTHKQVNLKLRAAVLMVDVVFTASAESFRLLTRKLRVMGHGIDVQKFSPASQRADSSVLRLVSIGRISATKRVMEMLDVCDVLCARGVPFLFTIVGAPATASDREYDAALRARIARPEYQGSVVCLGPQPQERLPDVLRRQDVALNLSQTGSMDKAVLEAMACGVRVVSTNEAFRAELEPEGLFVAHYAPEAAADAVLRAREVDPAAGVAYVQKQHSLPSLIKRILAVLG